MYENLKFYVKTVKVKDVRFFFDFLNFTIIFKNLYW